MAFTPDGLRRSDLFAPGVILAAGFNGYGGSYTTAAGQASAEMALTDESPDWTPPDVFSPRRNEVNANCYIFVDVLFINA